MNGLMTANNGTNWAKRGLILKRHAKMNNNKARHGTI